MNSTQNDMQAYAKAAQAAVTAAIERGYDDRENLREILGWAWQSPTAAMVDGYIRSRMSEIALLRKLVELALEGESCGDAPVAAAGYIGEFPAALLREIEPELRKLSQERLGLLSDPAKKALKKCRGG